MDCKIYRVCPFAANCFVMVEAQFCAYHQQNAPQDEPKDVSQGFQDSQQQQQQQQEYKDGQQEYLYDVIKEQESWIDFSI
jgi:hypothetical protein